MPRPTKMMSRKRILFMLVVYFLLSAFMVGRLAYWQLAKSEWLEAKAASQWTLDIPVEPKRGTIYDARQRPLAISVSADTVVAVPAQVVDADKTARLLAPMLEMETGELLERLSKKVALVYLKRKVEPELAEKVKDLGLPGIHFTEESKRYYPHRNLASHVLGFAGMDQGWNGTEYVYDEYLQGKKGAIQFEVDSRGQGRENREVSYVKPVDGHDIHLTLDMVIQNIVETRLEQALELHNATKVSAIVMDPKTGGILAMANKPDFDPNAYQAVGSELWRNATVSDAFEPGSTFKIITMAAALEENQVDLNDRFYDPGYIRVAGVRIGCWKAGGHGSQSYIEVVQNSCNPGFVALGMKLGKEKLFGYIDKFGFGDKTGIDLPGEGQGVMFKKEQIGPVELATTAFGQGPAVTPIQQVRAVAAIANKGVLPEPHVVEQVLDKEGEAVFTYSSQDHERVLSEETAQEMCDILESVVTDGTGNRAYMEGYRVAGKTGTAQVPQPGGGYYSNKYIASFIGFAPANDPQVVAYVMIEDPKGAYGYYGGVIAAPLFGEIMAEVLHYLEIEPQITDTEVSGRKIEVPQIVGLPVSAARAQLRAKGMVPQVVGSDNGLVVEQTPVAGTDLSMGSAVVIRSEASINQLPQEVIVPDISGLSMREASNILGLAGLRINIVGSGTAVEQDIKPQTKVNRNTVITVKFEAPSP